MKQIDSRRLAKHLTYLTEKVGVRLAGHVGERRAAKYLADQFAAAGAQVHQEAFPVHSRDVRQEQVQIYFDRAWHDAPCSLFANTPGTNGSWIEAPLYFFEAPTGYQTTDLVNEMKGCVVLHLGCHIESRKQYRRLMKAAPAGLLMVDVRYPGKLPLADAMFPAYTRALGAVPTFNVAFLDAWRWRERGATRARFRVHGGIRAARSANVVAELPGSEPAAGTLYIGAHHDTQAGSVGADDNATGVAGLLELARVLAPQPRRLTIRLISFGAEEQLSVGSAAYVRRHRTELTRSGKLMFNLDSFGSLLGWSVLAGLGSIPLEKMLLQHFLRHGHAVHLDHQVLPYADHFPFLAAGLPSFTLMRLNCSSGRFFHHRPDDTLKRLSLPILKALLDGVAEFVMKISQANRLPFRCTVPAPQQHAVSAYWRDLFGGWNVPGK